MRKRKIKTKDLAVNKDAKKFLTIIRIRKEQEAAEIRRWAREELELERESVNPDPIAEFIKMTEGI